jgi:hypothetical protein
LDKDAQEETIDTVRGYGGTLDPFHGQTKMCCTELLSFRYCLSDNTEEAAAIQFLEVFLPGVTADVQRFDYRHPQEYLLLLHVHMYALEKESRRVSMME